MGFILQIEHDFGFEFSVFYIECGKAVVFCGKPLYYFRTHSVQTLVAFVGNEPKNTAALGVVGQRIHYYEIQVIAVDSRPYVYIPVLEIIMFHGFDGIVQKIGEYGAHIGVRKRQLVRDYDIRAERISARFGLRFLHIQYCRNVLVPAVDIRYRRMQTRIYSGKKPVQSVGVPVFKQHPHIRYLIFQIVTYLPHIGKSLLGQSQQLVVRGDKLFFRLQLYAFRTLAAYRIEREVRQYFDYVQHKISKRDIARIIERQSANELSDKNH